MTAQIPGYAYGSKEVPQAPVSDEDFKLLKTTVLMTEEDVKYLRMAGEVLKDQVDSVLDLWYGWVGSHKHLVHYFGDRKTGQPIGLYLDAVRKRFGQWILDTCFREYDRQWLNYQYEIGRRHHREKKNKTDNVNSVEHIPLRYLIAFIVPITATIKPFLAKKGHSADDVEKMYNAWFKAVTLSVALWSIPYTNKGDW
ncbi:MAG: protoglobin domain-containing protein [Candidatus Caldarchaeum sp.]|nr:protoglobin domain-containing protein [Candidatus Caldarchaeum sp.]